MSMKKKVLTIGSVLALSLMVGTSALADTADTGTTPVQATIEAGGGGEGGAGALRLETTPINEGGFGTIVLEKDETAYQTSFSGPFTVTDLRGTHEGWALQLSADSLTNGDSVLTNALTIAGLEDISPNGTGNGEAPTNGNNAKTPIDDGTILISNAVEGTGMGAFDLEFPEDALELTVSAKTAKAGTYSTDLNWNLVNAPQ